jgi:hypothetical protein
MTDQFGTDEKIDLLAQLLTLLALVGRVDKTAMNRVLTSLGPALVSLHPSRPVPPNLARQLIVSIAAETDKETALNIAADLDFVAEAWRDVLDQFSAPDLHGELPYAEITFALANHTGAVLQERDTLSRFGGPDLILPMPQLSAALQTYPAPRTGLAWEMVGFLDPPDQALVASSPDGAVAFLFKAASSSTDLRFSELERNVGDVRHEHDVKMDRPMFAAFVAGLMGDLLYYAALLRDEVAPGHHVWARLRSLLLNL